MVCAVISKIQRCLFGGKFTCSHVVFPFSILRVTVPLEKVQRHSEPSEPLIWILCLFSFYNSLNLKFFGKKKGLLYVFSGQTKKKTQQLVMVLLCMVDKAQTEEGGLTVEYRNSAQALLNISYFIFMSQTLTFLSLCTTIFTSKHPWTWSWIIGMTLLRFVGLLSYKLYICFLFLFLLNFVSMSSASFMDLSREVVFGSYHCTIIYGKGSLHSIPQVVRL